MNETPNSSVEQGLYLADIKGEVTVIMQHKEAAGAEVAVEFDEDLIGGCGHALLYGAATELTNLRRGLVRSIPDKKGDCRWGRFKQLREEKDREKVHK